jgi:hypothetical protein
MEFIDEIFVGESIQDLGTIIYSLRRKIPVFQIYCICLFDEPQKRFEILSTRELFSKKNRNRHYVIAGIAGGKAEAEDLFLYMVETALMAGKDITNPLELIS